MHGFTVPQRIKYFHLDSSSQFAWHVGAAVRDAYVEIYAVSPKKELRPKTDGNGSHCFAVYPDEFMIVADEIILRMANSMYVEKARQFVLLL